MPAVDKIARFTPGRPGEGKFALIGFNGLQNLGEYTTGIDMLVVRRNEEHLGDWISSSPDGFIRVTPRRARQRALDFEFEVGPEVINPMAFDNSGDYILKIRDINGVVQSFVISLQAMPRASSAFGRAAIQERAAPAPGVVGGAGAAAGAAGAAGAADGDAPPPEHLKPHAPPPPPAPSKSPMILKIVGIICVLALIAGAVYFVLDMLNSKNGVDMPTDEQQQEQEQPQDGSSQDGSADVAAAGAATAAAGSCSLKGNTADDKTVISNCLASAPKADDIYSLLNEAMREQRCEIVQRILRTKGRAADGGPFAHVYARYSDPGSQFVNKCIEKNANDSQYWSQRVKADKNFDKREADKLMQMLQQQ